MCGYVVLAALGFASTSWLVSRVVPWPEDYGLRAKYDYFKQHKDEYDVAFVGSSRLFRGVDPRIVDAGLREQGVEARSINLAIGGMTGFESDFFVREIVRLEPARLKVIVLEDQPWDPNSYFLGNTFSSRNVFWHTPAETVSALRSVWSVDAPLTDHVEWSWTHARLCAMKLANVAQGPRIALDLLGKSRDPLRRALSTEQLAEGAGFQALDDLISGEFNPWREKLLANQEGFRAMVAAIPEQNARPVDLSRYNFKALGAQHAAAASIGAELVRLLPPGSTGQPEALELARTGAYAHTLDYNDPARFPRFFELEWRFDEHHLNRAGAQELSRLIGIDLAPLLKRTH
ncbi:MAG: hypothetical protein JNL28_04235 [Planctomycetes bacterium]|nr:hypothetical protein [Planctomycetota bacterium]